MPSGWIDKLFARFGAMYGDAWVKKWQGTGLTWNEVKAEWDEDLAGCSGDQLSRALAHVRGNCPFPPSLPEFLGFCRQFRMAESLPALPGPRSPVPQAAKDALADLHFAGPGRNWARKIMANEKAYPWISGVMAREALNLPTREQERAQNLAD